ncbi:MAG: PilZ domain-containing protein [Bradymonadia bacterium]
MDSNTYLQRIQDARQAALSSNESSLAIFDELERLLLRIDTAKLPARTHSELQRFIESDRSMQRARMALVSSLDGILRQLQAAADDVRPQQTGMPAYVGTVELPDVDLSDLMEHRAPPSHAVESKLALEPAGEPDWMAQVVSLSEPEQESIMPSGVAVYESVDTAVDPWDNLDIPELANGGELQPLDRLAERRGESGGAATLTPKTTAEASEYAAAGKPYRPHMEKDDELSMALDKLLSQPPRPVPPLPAEPQPATRDTVQIPLNVTAVIRAGQRLVSAHTDRVGPHGIFITARAQLEVGQIVHLFFELEPGRQVGVNCKVMSLESSGTGWLTNLKYLDLQEKTRQLILSAISRFAGISET